MPKLYGSFNNRYEENHIFLNEDGTVPEVKVGMGVTEYLYSDRYAYEITRVICPDIDRLHIMIRPVKAIHAKNYDYFGGQNIDHFESIPTAHEIELENFHGRICRVLRGEWGFVDGKSAWVVFKRPHHTSGGNYSLNVQEEYEDPSF